LANDYVRTFLRQQISTSPPAA